MQSLKPFYGLIMLAMFSSSTANATAAGRRVFGEGGVITFYNNVTCVGTESKLNVCQSIYSTSSRLDCGYAGVFCGEWFSPRQASDGVIVCVKFCCPLLYLTDFSEIGQTSRLPLPTSTVTQPNGVTSSSGDVEYCL